MRRRRVQPRGTGPEVVVVGAGFGGLAAARALAGSGARVTLVDRNIYSTFLPLLYQVATGGLNPGDVSYPLRSAARRYGAGYRRGTVRGLDLEHHQVLLADGGRLAFDHLVLAMGVAVNYFGVPGAAEHTRAIYTRGQSLQVRDELMGRLERLATGDTAELTIVVVGAGATGVEMAGTLAELRNGAVPVYYPEIDPARVHVVLVDQAPTVLGPYDEHLRGYARRALVERGVDVRLGAAIDEVRADAVVLAGGEVLDADLVVWAAGVGVPRDVAAWGLPQGSGGRILVGDDLRVHGHDAVFAVGDVALADGQPLPQLAQPAIQMGRHAGRQIRRLMAGQPTEAFRYRDKGTMATIGRRSAIAELPLGIRLHGTLAWLAWLGLHVLSLLGNRNRLSALLNLSWRYLAWPGGAGVVVGDTAEPG